MEKERYEYRKSEYSCLVGYIFDNFKNEPITPNLPTMISTLNQQDARIKELEIQVEKWKQDYENCSKLEKNLTKEHQYCLDNWRECEKENQQLKQQLEEKDKEIGKLSLYSERLYKLEARIGLEERTVGDVVEELDRLRNQLELSQLENKQLKQSQNQKAIDVLENVVKFINELARMDS